MMFHGRMRHVWNIFAFFVLLTSTALGQASLLPLEPGVASVTCFSGSINDSSHITLFPDNYVFGLIDLRTPPPARIGRNWNAPMYHHPSWTARNLGQVFGVALDDTGNIYVTATSMYGLPTNFNTVGVFGPAGPGGVYKIDGRTGRISIFAQLPNTRPGLGNICFDSLHHQFFITNFEDGKIYRLDMNGRVLNTFDPRGRDNGSSGMVSHGERVWGIGIHENVVYYAIWRENWRDIQNPRRNPRRNEIWSVALNSSGDFQTTTERIVLQIPTYPGPRADGRSSVVSDIAFAPDGRMLLGEATFFFDFGMTEFFSRLLEYRFNSGRWTGPKTIYVGTPYLNTNSQGGVDYGFNHWVQPSPSTAYESIWATGNPLRRDNVANAGLAGIPMEGNTQGTVAATSFYIDADGIEEKEGYVKALMGDVEIFKRFQYIDAYDTLTICDGEEIRLDGGSGTSWDWQEGPDIPCRDCRYIVISPSTTTDYVVESSVTPGVKQRRSFHVIVKKSAKLQGRLGIGSPHFFGDTVVGAILLQEVIDLQPLGRIDIELFYRPGTMQPLDMTPGQVMQEFAGTLLENWNVLSVNDDGNGRLNVACIAPARTTSLVTDTLARFRFSTSFFIDPGISPDSIADITLPVSIALPGLDPDCVTLEFNPGHLRLQLPDRYDTLTICEGESVTLDAGDGIAWNWSSEPGLDCYDCQIPTASPRAPITYTVETLIAPRLKQTKHFHVDVTQLNDVNTWITSEPLYAFGDTVEIALLIQDPIDLETSTNLSLNLFYRNHTMVPIGATPDSLQAILKGTLLQDWVINTFNDDGNGTLHLSCTPPATPSIIVTDTLARFRFATFAVVDPTISPDSTTKINLPFTLELRDLECSQILERPGYFELFLPDLHDTVHICEDESISLDGGEGIAWSWEQHESLSCNDCRRPIASPKTATTYNVRTTEAPGLFQHRSVHVRLSPPTVIRAHIGEYGPHIFGDTTTIELILDDPLKGIDLNRIDVSFFYDARGMLPVVTTLEEFAQGLEGTLLEGWHIDELYDDYQGTLKLSLTPPSPSNSHFIETGTLMRVRFATFLGLDPSIIVDSLGRIPLPFTLTLFDPYCTEISETPGAINLGICGLHHRLIEMTFSKYSLLSALSPINDIGELQFSLGLDGPTQLELFDLQGNRVVQLIDEHLEAGEYDLQWDASILPSGLYFYRLESGDWGRTKRVIIQR